MANCQNNESILIAKNSTEKKWLGFEVETKNWGWETSVNHRAY